MRTTTKLIAAACLSLLPASACVRPDNAGQLRALAVAPTVDTQPYWRVRIPSDIELAPGLSRRLCDEFRLVEIHTADDLEAFCKQVGWHPTRQLPDLSAGMLVGVIADVGEPVSHRWPVAIDRVRLLDGAAWIRAKFNPGVYHPIRASSFCELVYIPNLTRVVMVEINRRTFLAQ